jgi:hypothetical protein
LDLPVRSAQVIGTSRWTAGQGGEGRGGEEERILSAVQLCVCKSIEIRRNSLMLAFCTEQKAAAMALPRPSTHLETCLFDLQVIPVVKFQPDFLL